MSTLDGAFTDAESIARTNELTSSHSIQEALRMYLPPIKNDDPQFDFYTMYKRETMEYDTEYMQKYNEGLNTSCVSALLVTAAYSVDPHSQAGLFSAVSSAFVIDIQSKLQPDPNERSEAYLRAMRPHKRWGQG